MQKGYEAQQVNQEGKKNKKQKDVKELRGYMALRNNVRQIKLRLWKEVKPLEYFLVDFIIDRTIGWRQEEAPIKMEDFIEYSGQKHPHIYVALKKLEKEKIIFRRKVEHHTYYSLNHDYFGALLIKRHKDALEARRNKFKVVVDNSKNDVRDSYKPCTNSVQPLYEIRTEKDSQDIENIDENMSLNKVFKEISLKADQKSETAKESFTLPGEEKTKTKRSKEEHERIVREQVAQLKAEALTV